ncbi:Man1-Src1p-C-terminal domain-containing protein [Pilaira anomala]|nr:Man1-Src1p-C-terminal domain-containing protein [Pilaira anomala]
MNIDTEIPQELYYLDDQFSVRSLRKYQLKEILTSHNIPYLSNITRPDLVKLFQKHVQDRREDILNEYRSKEPNTTKVTTNRSTTGYGRGLRVSQKPKKYENDYSITEDSDGFKIPSVPKRKTESYVNPEDSFASEDEEYMSATKPSVKKKLQQQTIKVTHSLPKEKPVRVSPAKEKPVRFSPPAFNEEDSFASSGDESIYQRPSQSVATDNHVQLNPTEEEEFSAVAEIVDDVTVNEILEETIVTREDTLDEAQVNEDEKAEKKEEKNAGEDEEYQADTNSDDEDEEYQGDTDSDDEDEEEELGEVEKEELVQLFKDQSKPPQAFLARPPKLTVLERINKTRKSFKKWEAVAKRVLFILSLVYLIIGMLGFGITTYARRKNGYCTTHPQNVNHTKPSGLLSILPSSCIPCPDHGICSNGELECDALYERKKPFYNIGNVLPIADECVHNSVLGRHVRRVEKKIKNYLAMRQGEAYCHYLMENPELGEKDIPVTRTSVKEILADLKPHLQEQLPADKMDEILFIAISAVLEDPTIYYWETDNQRFLGTERVKLSFGCKVKQLYVSVPNQIKMYILAFVSIVAAVAGASKEYRKKKAYEQKINQLVKSTINQLKQQYDNHIKSPALYPTPVLAVPQIRSSIVDLNDVKTIDDWQRVAEKVKAHPHVRASFREVRGDQVEFWELTT